MNQCWREGCAGSSSADLGTHIKWDTHPLGRTPARIYGMALPANAFPLEGFFHAMHAAKLYFYQEVGNYVLINTHEFLCTRLPEATCLHEWFRFGMSAMTDVLAWMEKHR